jgi:hypothetical protein
MTRLVDTVGFAGKVYAIADFDDGGRFHFYDGTRLTDWDTVAAASADFSTLAQFMSEKVGADNAVTCRATDNVLEITAKVPGTPFTIAAAAVEGGSTDDQTATVATPQVNVVPVAEVLATATIEVTAGTDGTIDNILLGSTDVLGAPLAWSGSNAATAIRIAQRINSQSVVTGYSASAADAIVTLSALAGTGATPNGTGLTVNTTGNIAVSASDSFSGGVTAVAAVAQVSTVTFGGTFEADDVFTVTINGVDYVGTPLASATGKSCNVHYKRVWSPANSLWRYCKLSDATVWNPATSGSDAGYLNVAEDSEGNENLVCSAPYQTLVAVYSEQAVILYTLDTDPANFAQYMVLNNTSTTAAKSVVRYGNNDVFHMDPTGIRSLRALNVSNAPFVSDVGNAVDTFVLAFLDTLTESERRTAVAAIEPRDGRFMLAVGERVFVLSFFPGAKISAWSYYSPGFAITHWAKIQRQLYARAGNTVYLYGGADGETYPDDDEYDVLVELPFLSAGTPATRKGLDGFDAAFSNVWKVDALIDPNREDKEIHIGVVKDKTYQGGDISLPGQGPLVALKFTCSRAGRATISMAQIHFEKQDEG